MAASSGGALQITNRDHVTISNRAYVGMMKSKPSPKVVTALARELLGFIWAIGRETEQVEAAKRAA